MINYSRACFFFYLVSHQATFLTLCAGSVFNTRPRCEDPLKAEGSTLLWCDALSITVGLVDIAVLAAIGVCFVYIKIKSTSTEAVKEKAEEKALAPKDSSTKKRRLSSRELMVEMAAQQLQVNNPAIEEGGEEGRDVIVTLGINPMHGASGKTTAVTHPTTATTSAAARARWNKLKHATRVSRTFRDGGKQRVKRLSKVMVGG